MVAYIERHREDPDRPFEVVLGGRTPDDPAEAGALIRPLVQAGATWWDERQVQGTDELDRLTPVLRRIDAGVPAL
jgi:hypothetical protein